MTCISKHDLNEENIILLMDISKSLKLSHEGGPFHGVVTIRSSFRRTIDEMKELQGSPQMTKLVISVCKKVRFRAAKYWANQRGTVNATGAINHEEFFDDLMRLQCIRNVWFGEKLVFQTLNDAATEWGNDRRIRMLRMQSGKERIGEMVSMQRMFAGEILWERVSQN